MFAQPGFCRSVTGKSRSLKPLANTKTNEVWTRSYKVPTFSNELSSHRLHVSPGAFTWSVEIYHQHLHLDRGFATAVSFPVVHPKVDHDIPLCTRLCSRMILTSLKQSRVAEPQHIYLRSDRLRPPWILLLDLLPPFFLDYILSAISHQIRKVNNPRATLMVPSGVPAESRAGSSATLVSKDWLASKYRRRRSAIVVRDWLAPIMRSDLLAKYSDSCSLLSAYKQVSILLSPLAGTLR